MGCCSSSNQYHQEQELIYQEYCEQYKVSDNIKANQILAKQIKKFILDKRLYNIEQLQKQPSLCPYHTEKIFPIRQDIPAYFVYCQRCDGRGVQALKLSQQKCPIKKECQGPSQVLIQCSQCYGGGILPKIKILQY